MQNENDLGTSTTGTIETNTPPDLSVISPIKGWQTSEGQITGFLTFALTVLAFMGYHFSADQTQNWYDLIHQIFLIVGPLGAVTLVLWNYITSRGKTKSNAINATAALNIAQFAGASQFGGLGSILGGKSWKDPSRYINIVKDLNATGIIPGPAGKIIDATIGKPGSSSDDSEFQSEVTTALQQFDARIKALEAKQ